MKKCKYIINGNSFSSYSELLDYISTLGNLNLDSISDIVYSKSNKQSTQVEKLNNLKATYIPKKNSVSFTDSEPQAEGALSITDFLDSPACVINGRPLVTPLSREDYKKKQIEKIVEQGISQEEAESIVDTTTTNWDRIQEDSLSLHQTFTDFIISSPDATEIDFASKFKNAMPQSLSSTRLMMELYNKLKRFYISEKGKYPDSKTVRNINLISKIKGLDQELLGHIDYLFVGQDGTLHLYLFKVSTTTTKEWPQVKKEKYMYQLAFLKHMLSNNGIDVKNIDLNIVPVQLTYNDDFTEVQSLEVHFPIQYSTRRSGSEYAMAKYDRQVSSFIEDSYIPDSISDKPIERADQVNRAIFPDLNIRVDGIALSAIEWIKSAPTVDLTGTEPLVIKEIGDPDHAYDVIIDGKVHPIKSGKSKTNNEEIINLVSQHINKLDDNKGYSTQRLKDAIKNSYKKGFPVFSSIPGLMNYAASLEAVLTKYLDYTEDPDTKIKNFKWELLDNLVDSNVLIFRNKEDNTIDLISLTSFDLNVKASLRLGSNILGGYKLDTQYNELEANYGNIEAVRAMELLNEILPQLDNVRLGTLGILSSINNASYRKYDIGQFNKLYFQTILDVVGKENQELEIVNNFKQAKFVDPIESILEEYLLIVQDKPSQEKADYAKYGFDQLTEDGVVVSSTDKKLKALQYIQQQILSVRPNLANPEYFEKALTAYEPTTRDMAKLYDLVTKAYLSIAGETPTYQTKLDPVSKMLFTAPTVPDPNIRIVVNNLQITHDAIASEFLSVYDKHIRNHFDTYYQKIGYTSLENMTLGDQAAQYDNMFEKDVRTGKNTMVFKNPYDTSNNLTEPERNLLKQVLFQIAMINHNGNFNFSSPTDSRLKEYIEKHPEYLWVPLERASRATSRRPKNVVNGMKNSFKRWVKASESFDEFVANVTEEEREDLGGNTDNFYQMTLRNPFERSMPSSRSSIDQVYKERQRMLEKYGPEFFETNVENIMIDFLAKHISTTQLNKLLISSKALLLQLHLTGNFAGNRNVVEKEVKYIQDYLKVNVFNTSIMSEQEKKIIGVIQPTKKLVTDILLGGNVVSAVRDSLEGLQQNLIRSLIKFNTDIDPESVRKAYKYVMIHSTSDAMAVNLLSKLCLKYRLSNTDVGRIAERAKSGRNGIYNYDNWLYSTLRGPDFLNRMVLFVARCMHDGVWDAYSIDNDNNLVYDWKKDIRFSIYASGNTDHPEYKIQKARYLSRILTYNKEHPDNPINPEDGLPDPYSDKEILSIRALADNIYGAYDLGKKAMYENLAITTFFGMFTTWMGAIVNNYMMTPQKSYNRLREEQETDEQGNKLYFDKDGNITIEDTGVPILKYDLVLGYGIIPTIMAAVKLCRKKGITEAKKYLTSDPIAKANMLKLTSDLLMWFLLSSLFKLLLDPAYKEHKKTAQDNPVILNLITEIIYKGSSKAYDQYKGLINVVQHFGEDSNALVYTIPFQIINDAMSYLLGEKSWKYLLFDNTGFTRSFRDTFFAFLKSIEK